ncbi:MAG: hypothetical protein ACI3XR_00465 [Eubacteriales bacterium]
MWQDSSATPVYPVQPIFRNDRILRRFKSTVCLPQTVDGVLLAV